MNLRRLFVLTVFIALCSSTGIAQITSNGTTGGNWNAPSTWLGGVVPTGSETITILSTDTVDVNVPVTITGMILNQGRIVSGQNLTIAENGVFQHNQDGGSLPLATWGTGSTLMITGVSGVAPSNGRQNFYNIVFNTPDQLSNLNLGWDSVTIGGDITVINTGSARWQMTAPTAGDSSLITLMGDVIVTGGAFSSNGTSNANTKITIHHYGSIIATGGNISVSRGSQGSGTGSTRWYMHEGDIIMSNATTQNSNAANAWFIFDKAGTQTITLGEGNTITALPIVVTSGTILDLGGSEIRGSGRFELNAGTTLATANEGGIDSTVNITGNKVLSTEANYIFNGSVAQFTGLTLPGTVNNLTIDNASGVTLSQATTINGVLALKAGVFDNTIPFTLGPSDSVSLEGGSLLVTSVKLPHGSIPQSYFVNQNYPNPFNPTTIISYGIPRNEFVTITLYNLIGQEINVLFEGIQDAGYHELNFNAAGLNSGVYFYKIQAGNFSEVKRMVLLK